MSLIRKLFLVYPISSPSRVRRYCPSFQLSGLAATFCLQHDLDIFVLCHRILATGVSNPQRPVCRFDQRPYDSLSGLMLRSLISSLQHISFSFAFLQMAVSWSLRSDVTDTGFIVLRVLCISLAFNPTAPRWLLRSHVPQAVSLLTLSPRLSPLFICLFVFLYQIALAFAVLVVRLLLVCCECIPDPELPPSAL